MNPSFLHMRNGHRFVGIHRKLVMEVKELCNSLATQYKKETPAQVKLLDVFIAFSALSAILLAIYCFLVGTYPFNAFLAGFIACMGSCVLSSRDSP